MRPVARLHHDARQRPLGGRVCEHALMHDLDDVGASLRNGEASRRVDVSALVTSIIDDMSEAGMPVVSGQVQAGLIVECRPVALRRALANLIDNAVKYGERATVSLSTMGPNVAIDVDDEGPGIPEDQLSDVLQPFYRIENSRNRDTGGIGLGLAIASSIAENHGGALKLSNRRQQGLRATFEIPR